MPAYHVARALAAYGRELRFAALQRDQVHIGHARKNARGGLLRQQRKLPSRPPKRRLNANVQKQPGRQPKLRLNANASALRNRVINVINQ